MVSWDFKRIVNVYKIRGYNSINIRMNYQALEIHSPKEILLYEDVGPPSKQYKLKVGESLICKPREAVNSVPQRLSRF